MDAEWINSSTGLPRDGEQIEFELDDRMVAMHGTYALPSFHSHWADYGVERVRRWRNLSPMLDLAAAASDQVACAPPAPQDHDSSPPFFFAGRMAHVT